MFDYTIEIDDDVLNAIADTLTKAPRALTTVIDRSILPDFRRRIAKVTETPGPPRYPIRWKSERQRRAFFATNGFGKGIPYRRTGALAEGWHVEYAGIRDGGSIRISNAAPYARFVVGDDQQPFHADTGWKDAGPELVRIEDDLQDAVIEAWYSVVDIGKGVRLT